MKEVERFVSAIIFGVPRISRVIFRATKTPSLILVIRFVAVAVAMETADAVRVLFFHRVSAIGLAHLGLLQDIINSNRMPQTPFPRMS